MEMDEMDRKKEQRASTRDEEKRENGEEARTHTHTGSEFAHLFVFANEKAGMKKVDMEKVNQVVYEMSKGSDFFEHARKQDEKVQGKVKEMKEKLANISAATLDQVHRVRVEEICAKLMKSAKMERIYAVLDMDMFFAAVEMRDNPSLIGKPVAVGGNAMISTANYEARQYGVRSAMPGFIAKKLCPDLIFVGGPGSFDKYKKASREVREVLEEYDPNLSGSIDEAYMDLSDYILANFDQEGSKSLEERMNFAFETVREMRRRVSLKTKLTCSAGISTNRTIAKVASDFNKPNGQHMVPADLDAMRDFVHRLPIRKVPGIGKVTEKVLLDTLGIRTVADLWAKRVSCCAIFSKRTFECKFMTFKLILGTMKSNFKTGLMRVCLCCPASSGTTPFDSKPTSRKSISTERTFRDKENEEELMTQCKKLCKDLATQCAEKNIRGRCFTLKLKTSAFDIRTRQVSFAKAVPRCLDGKDLFEKASELLRKEFPCKLRLMGVKISQLEESSKSGASQGPMSAFLASSKQKNNIVNSGDESDESCTSCLVPESDRNEFKNDKMGSKMDHQTTRCISESTSSRNEVTCPLCGKTLPNTNNNEVNAHIDQCLSTPLLDALCTEENSSHYFEEDEIRPMKKSRKSTIDTFFQRENTNSRS